MSPQDVKTLKLTPNSTRNNGSTNADKEDGDLVQFVCPFTRKEMNGAQPFVYIWTCGCVFSQAGFKTVSSSSPSSSSPSPPASNTPSDGDTTAPTDTAATFDLCPQCSAKYSKATDILILNPSPEEESEMRFRMDARRLSAAAKTKKRKAPSDEAAPAELPSAKRLNAKKIAAPHISPSVVTASRAVVESLAAEEAKRKDQMSDAVKSLYGSKDRPPRKETFMTMGTFTRVSSFGTISFSLTHSVFSMRNLSVCLGWRQTSAE